MMPVPLAAPRTADPPPTAAPLSSALAWQALDACANGVLVVDAVRDGMPIVYANAAFERLTGYTCAEVLGRNCRFLQEADRDQPAIATLRAAVAAGREAVALLRNYRKDGTLFWNELKVTPVHDAHGQVTHFIGVQNDVSRAHRVEFELARRAALDPMTGLPVGALLVERARDALTLARRQRRRVAMLGIAIDGLRRQRGAFGHTASDALLRDVAARVQACLRDGDTLGRIGADDFYALLPGLADADEALALAGRARAAVDEALRAAPRGSAACRIGVALDDSDDSDTDAEAAADTLLHQTGFALAEAGTEAPCVYSSELGAAVRRRAALQRELEGAIADGQMRLRFQPQIALGSGRVVGVEALVRWMHPVHGEISPAEFITMAEATGQIVALGDWVLVDACRRHRRWLDQGLLDGSVAVNVSILQLRRPGFADRVMQVLQDTGLAPHRLELELTESVLMDSSEASLAMLRSLRDQGVRLSIDDFGTGYSSLGYLRRLPVHTVKIDRSFVRDLERDADNASITLSVISLAHHLRLNVVAEGVESEAQLAYLRRNLCDVAQGFHIAPPLDPAALEAFLAAWRPPALDEVERPTLLLVDDEPNVLRSLQRGLRRDGYRVLTAGGAEAALDLLARHDVQVVLSDQRMPGMQGTELLGRVRVLYPHTVRMVLSGYTDLATVTEAVNKGAIYRFLTKPWDEAQLRAHLKDAFRHAARLRAERAAP